MVKEAYEPALSTPTELQPRLAQLTALERLYHAAFPGATLAHFDRLVAAEFWEIGASGRNYSRAFARSVLAERERLPLSDDWLDDEHVLAEVAGGLFLLTYTLRQPGRTTRRMSLWRCAGTQWQVVFHQGTTCT